MLGELVTKLADTPWSIALHESLYMYAITESTHVLSIMLFVGSIAMVDLRLLGISYTRVPVSQMLSRILPWTVAGFAGGSRSASQSVCALAMVACPHSATSTAGVNQRRL